MNKLNVILIVFWYNRYYGTVPFTLMANGSDDKVNPTVVTLQKYEPLSDCCIGLN